MNGTVEMIHQHNRGDPRQASMGNTSPIDEEEQPYVYQSNTVLEVKKLLFEMEKAGVGRLLLNDILKSTMRCDA